MRFCFCLGTFHAVPDPLLIRRVQKEGISRNNAVFWDEVERVYRGMLPLFVGQRRSRVVKREIHTDMLLRAAFARDGSLARRILRRATFADVSIARLLGSVLWRALRAHLR